MDGRRKFLSFLSLLLALFLLFVFTWNTSLPNSYNLNSAKRVAEELELKPHHQMRHHESHASDTPRHPLDPLTVQEMNRVRSILSSHALFRASKSYALHSVALEEPPKSRVLTWREGDPLPPRQASVVARLDRVSHVLTVDLESGRVARVDTGPLSGYPTMTIEDMNTATFTPFLSEEFNRTLVARGVDLKDVACLPISTGKKIRWFVCFLDFFWG
uniref:Amine oxidase n=1 Tax=Opuntia streptacantha TaxID=393608 RepID=A0A7C9D6K3_OPUST